MKRKKLPEWFDKFQEQKTNQMEKTEKNADEYDKLRLVVKNK